MSLSLDTSSESAVVIWFSDRKPPVQLASYRVSVHHSYLVIIVKRYEVLLAVLLCRLYFKSQFTQLRAALYETGY